MSVMDLGTNTFHLLIARLKESLPEFQPFEVIHKEKIAVKIGQGCINQGIINQAAQLRMFEALRYFQLTLREYAIDPGSVSVMATSALRNASNGYYLSQRIKDEFGLNIQIIDGEQEAELIYYGVKAYMPISPSPCLIMDIGGGSVEFVLASEEQILWKKSIEIGAQRLFDLFMHHDPIGQQELKALHEYLSNVLHPLFEACQQYNPQSFVGSSGTFDTLKDILEAHKRTPQTCIYFDDFYWIYQQLLSSNRQQRLAIPGMAEMRVDMIVVASALLYHVMHRLNLPHFKVSLYSLKEGVLYKKLLDLLSV